MKPNCEDDNASHKANKPSQYVIPQPTKTEKSGLEGPVAAATSDNGNVHSLFQEGDHLIEAGKLIEGLKVLSQLLEIEPNHFETHQLLGELYHQLGKETEAKQMWELALAQQPNNLELLKKLGRLTASPAEGNGDALLKKLSSLIAAVKFDNVTKNT